jgi:phosphate transport system permease protein
MQSAGRRKVADLALQGGAIGSGVAAERSRALSKLKLGDSAFRHLTRAAAVFVLLLLSGVILSLVIGSWPALVKFGAGFLVSERWNPVTENFGALAPIYGTVVTR